MFTRISESNSDAEVIGRPRDFLKVMWGAQIFIYTVYLVYGCFIYHYQGQYSFQPTYLGISNYGMFVQV
jgi:hypothetical protein